MKTPADGTSFDFVIIATLRPEILRLTLDSFRPLFECFPNRRLILNVDPVGEQSVGQQQIIDLCASYFSEVLSRAPAKGSFSEAVFWAWGEVKSDVFFHLEDDWCLKSPIDVVSAAKALEDENVVAVRLNLKKNLTRDSDGFSLNPSFFKTKFIKSILSNFDVALDPEKQYRPMPDGFLDSKIRYYGKVGDGPFVIDTGKRWRKMHGLVKWVPGGENGVTWGSAKVSSWFAFLKYKLFLIYWRLRYV